MEQQRHPTVTLKIPFVIVSVIALSFVMFCTGAVSNHYGWVEIHDYPQVESHQNAK